MQPTTDILPEPAPRQRARPPVARGAVKPRAAAGGNAAGVEGMLACFAVTAGGLGATAALGGLRLADLAISGMVMLGMIVLGLRDSPYLPVGVMATWMFTPMVRRIVDWQSGGYTSVTSLSLLPMMATSALVIPMYRRLRVLPRTLWEPLLLMAVPVVIASVLGVFRYGPGAVLEAGEWLLPLLFIPYLATRPTTGAERFWLLRAAVLLAAVAAAYGLYQFFVLPNWDRLWLFESGMMGSMGRPIPMEIRVWGPLNSTGTAAAVWAMAIVTAFADRGWRPAVRYPAIGLMAFALALTLVRIGWLMAVIGLIVQVAISGRRGGASIAVSAALVGAALLVALPFVPKGDKVMDRLLSFSDLENDTSYNDRKMTTQAMMQKVADQPLGVGMGYVTAAKIAGKSNAIEGVDNGYADMALTLGWVGAAAYAWGFARLFGRSLAVTRQRGNADRAWSGDLGALACAVLATVVLCTFAAFSMLSMGAAWASCCVGVAVSPLTRPRVSPSEPAGVA